MGSVDRVDSVDRVGGKKRPFHFEKIFYVSRNGILMPTPRVIIGMWGCPCPCCLLVLFSHGKSQKKIDFRFDFL